MCTRVVNPTAAVVRTQVNKRIKLPNKTFLCGSSFFGKYIAKRKVLEYNKIGVKKHTEFDGSLYLWRNVL